MDPGKRLYQELFDKGLYTKSYEEFEKQYGGDGYKGLYDKMREKKLTEARDVHELLLGTGAYKQEAARRKKEEEVKALAEPKWIKDAKDDAAKAEAEQQKRGIPDTATALKKGGLAGGDGYSPTAAELSPAITPELQDAGEPVINKPSPLVNEQEKKAAAKPFPTAIADIRGKEFEIPLDSPDMTDAERQAVANGEPPASAIDKAIKYAETKDDTDVDKHWTDDVWKGMKHIGRTWQKVGRDAKGGFVSGGQSALGHAASGFATAADLKAAMDLKMMGVGGAYTAMVKAQQNGVFVGPGAALHQYNKEQQAKSKATASQYDQKGVGFFVGGMAPYMVGTVGAIATAPISAPLSAAIGTASMVGLGAVSIGAGIHEYDEYHDEKGRDYDPVTRVGVGALYGVAEMAMERLKLDFMIPKAAKGKLGDIVFGGQSQEAVERIARELLDRFVAGSETNKALVKQALVATGKGVVVEGTTEAMTQLAQELTNFIYQDKEDWKKWSEILNEVGMAALGGAVMGTATGPLSYGSQRIMTKQRRAKAGEVQIGVNKASGEAVEIVGSREQDGGIVFDVIRPNGFQAEVKASDIGAATTLTTSQFDLLLRGKFDGYVAVQAARNIGKDQTQDVVAWRRMIGEEMTSNEDGSKWVVTSKTDDGWVLENEEGETREMSNADMHGVMERSQTSEVAAEMLTNPGENVYRNATVADLTEFVDDEGTAAAVQMNHRKEWETAIGGGVIAADIESGELDYGRARAIADELGLLSQFDEAVRVPEGYEQAVDNAGDAVDNAGEAAASGVEATAKALEGVDKETIRNLGDGGDLERFRETLSESDKADWDRLMAMEFDKTAKPKEVQKLRDKFKPLEQEYFSKNFPTAKSVSEAYHKAKSDDSNPELVAAVEELLGKKTETKPAEPTFKQEVEATTQQQDVSPLDALYARQSELANARVEAAMAGDKERLAAIDAERKDVRERIHELTTAAAVAKLDEKPDQIAAQEQEVEQYARQQGIWREDIKHEAKPEPVVERKPVDVKGNEAQGVREVGVETITTDEARFQNRKKLDQAHVDAIAEKWNPAKQDPIHVWTDPQDGKTYVLSGHHRFAAAQQAGQQTVRIQDMSSEFSEAEAIAFAKEEANANRKMETAAERSQIYRKMRAEGKSKAEIERKGRELEGANWKEVERLSHINPDGELMRRYESIEGADNKRVIEKQVQYIGEARRLNPALTDAHENEMLAYLDKRGDKYVRMSDFTQKVGSLWRDADKPLGLMTAAQTKTEAEKEIEAEIKASRDNIDKLNGEIQTLKDRMDDPNHKAYIKPGTPGYDGLMKRQQDLIAAKTEEIKAERQRIIEANIRLGKALDAKANSGQGDLFTMMDAAADSGAEAIVSTLSQNEIETIGSDESQGEGQDKGQSSGRNDGGQSRGIDDGTSVRTGEGRQTQKGRQLETSKTTTNGRIERLSPEQERGRAAGGEVHVGASIVTARLHQAIGANKRAKGEVIGEEETYLETYAKAAGVWVDNTDTKYGEPHDGGQEQSVYYHGNGYVTKLNHGALSENWMEFLDRIAIHNYLFPDTKYEVVGFGREGDGTFVAILSQQHIIGEKASHDEVVSDMAKMGFRLQKQGGQTQETGDRVFVNDKTGVHIEDLHLGNVVKSGDKLFYIDPVITKPDGTKSGIIESNKAVKDALNDFLSEFDDDALGFSADPKEQAERELRKLQKGVKLVSAFIDNGVTRLEDIMTQLYDRIGDKLDDVFDAIKKAYGSYMATANDAVADKMDDIKTVRSISLDKIKADAKAKEGRGEQKAEAGTTNTIGTPDTGGRGTGPTTGSTAGNRTKRPALITLTREKVPEPTKTIAEGDYPLLDSEQVFAVNVALARFRSGDNKGFMLADGTGVGKTMQILAVADQYVKEHGKPVLIISENKQILENNFKRDAGKLGIDMDRFDVGTYHDVRGLKVGKEYGLVIFDEAHNLKNQEAGKTIEASKIKRNHTMFVTATPMDTASGSAYFIAEVTNQSVDDVYAKMGFTKRVVKTDDGVTEFLVLREGVSPVSVRQNIVGLRDDMIEAGAMMRREYPFWGTITESGIGTTTTQREQQAEIESYWEDVEEESRNENGWISPKKLMSIRGQMSGELSRWNESQKVEYVFAQAMKDLQQGKSVVIIAEGINETMIKGLGRKVPGFIGEIEKKFAAAGIRTAKIYGDNKKGIANTEFQEGEARVVIGTAESASTGIDLDDQIGNAPRRLYMVTPNYSGNKFQQILGRVSRRNTASPAEVELVFNDTTSDARRKEIVSGKLTTLKAIQEGIIDDAIDLEISEDSGSVGVGDLSFDDISDKAFVVRGKTYAIKDVLKEELRGTWNSREKAWMFPKSRKAEVMKRLGGEGEPGPKFRRATNTEASSQSTVSPELMTALGKAFPGVEVIIYNDIADVPNGQTIQDQNGTVYGFVVGNKIYLNGDVLNNNTPIHEYGHVWAEMVRQSRPELWNKIKTALKGTQYYADVLQNYPELQNEDAVIDEAFATLLGDFGNQNWETVLAAAKGDATVYGKVVAFLNEIIDYIKAAFGIDGYNAEDIAAMSLREMLGGREALPQNLQKFFGKVLPSDLMEAKSIMDSGFDRTQDVGTVVEMAGIKRVAEASGEYMVAPNGEQSALTPNDWLWVRSEEYALRHGRHDDQAWPKGVVDGNGEPTLTPVTQEVRFAKIKNEKLFRWLRGHYAMEGVTTDELHKALLNAGFDGMEFRDDQIPFVKELAPQLFPDAVKEGGTISQPEFNQSEFEANTGGRLIKITSAAQLRQYEKHYGKNRLCTFNDVEGRMRSYDIWVFERNGFDAIQPKAMPSRYDDYSTSLLMIQRAKPGYSGDDFIISRYNHAVSHPNYLYDNANFDSFYPGLGKHLEQKPKKVRKESLGRDYLIHENKIYRFESEINGIATYYNKRGVVRNNVLHEINPDYQTYIGEAMVMDNRAKSVYHIEDGVLIQGPGLKRDEQGVVTTTDGQKWHPGITLISNIETSNHVLEGYGNLILPNLTKARTIVMNRGDRSELPQLTQVTGNIRLDGTVVLHPSWHDGTAEITGNISTYIDINIKSAGHKVIVENANVKISNVGGDLFVYGNSDIDVERIGDALTVYDKSNIKAGVVMGVVDLYDEAKATISEAYSAVNVGSNAVLNLGHAHDDVAIVRRAELNAGHVQGIIRVGDYANATVQTTGSNINTTGAAEARVGRVGGMVYADNNSNVYADSVKEDVTANGNAYVVARHINESAYSYNAATIKADVIGRSAYSEGDSKIVAGEIGRGATASDNSTITANNIGTDVHSVNESKVVVGEVGHDVVAENSSVVVAGKIRLGASTTGAGVVRTRSTGMFYGNGVEIVPSLEVETVAPVEIDVPKFHISGEQQSVAAPISQQVVDRVAAAFPNVDVVTDPQAIDAVKAEMVAAGLMAAGDNPLGFVYRGVVHIDTRIAGPDTAVHEFGHIWATTTKVNNYPLFRRGLDLMRGTEYEARVRANPAYAGLTELQVLEEALALAIGEKGAAILNEKKQSQFQAYMKKVWAFVKNAMRLTKSPMEMTAAEFVEAAAKQVVGGKKISGVTSAQIAAAEARVLPMFMEERTVTGVLSDMGSLDSAREMAMQGQDARSIEVATGWHIGPDHKWRRSVDVELNVRRGFKTGDRLGDVVDATELFEMYPEARDIPIVVNPDLGHAAGYDFRSIHLREGKGEGVKQHLLHEVQHWIQHQEGLITPENSVDGTAAKALLWKAVGGFPEQYHDYSEAEIVAALLEQYERTQNPAIPVLLRAYKDETGVYLDQYVEVAARAAGEGRGVTDISDVNPADMWWYNTITEEKSVTVRPSRAVEPTPERRTMVAAYAQDFQDAKDAYLNSAAHTAMTQHAIDAYTNDGIRTAQGFARSLGVTDNENLILSWNAAMKAMNTASDTWAASMALSTRDIWNENLVDAEYGMERLLTDIDKVMGIDTAVTKAEHRTWRSAAAHKAATVIEKVLGPLSQGTGANIVKALRGKDTGAASIAPFSSKSGTIVARVEALGLSLNDLGAIAYAKHAPSRNARVAEMRAKAKENFKAVLNTKLEEAVAAGDTAKAQYITTLLQDVINDNYKPELVDRRYSDLVYTENNAVVQTNHTDTGSGMSDDAASDFLMQHSGNAAEINSILAELHELLVKGKLDILLDSGIIGLEQYQALLTGTRKGYSTVLQHYVPLSVDEEIFSIDSDTGEANVSGIFALVGAPDFDINSRYNPVATMLNQYKAAVMAAARNDFIKKAVAEVEAADAEAKVRGLESPFKRNTPSTKHRAGTIDKDGKLIFDKADENIRANSISYWVDGKERLLTFPRVVQGGKSRAHPVVTAVNEHGVPDWMDGYVAKIYMAAMNLQRVLYTQWNAFFGVRNFIRDNFEVLAHIPIFKEVGATKFAMEVLKQGGGYGVGLRQLLRNKKVGAATLRYMEAGGFMTWANVGKLGREIDDFQDLLDKLDNRKTATGVTKQVLSTIPNVLGSFNDAAENATRIAVFMAAENILLKDGRSAADATKIAAGIAKQITINFEKKGRKMKTANAVWMFSSVAMQSAQMAVRTVRYGSPWLTGMAAVAAINRALAYAVMDDEDDRDELERAILMGYDDRYLLLANPAGGAPIRMNKSYGIFKVPVGVGENIVDIAMGVKTPTMAALSVWGSLASSFLPIIGEQEEINLPGFAPTLFTPEAQVLANETWFGQEIKERFPRNFEGREPWRESEKFKKYAAPWAKDFAQGLEKATRVGGEQGLIDINPDLLQYWVKQRGSGLITDAANFAQSWEGVRKLVEGDAMTVEGFDAGRNPVTKNFYAPLAKKDAANLRFVYSVVHEKAVSKMSPAIVRQLDKALDHIESKELVDGKAMRKLVKQINLRYPDYKRKEKEYEETE